MQTEADIDAKIDELLGVMTVNTAPEIHEPELRCTACGGEMKRVSVCKLQCACGQELGLCSS